MARISVGSDKVTIDELVNYLKNSKDISRCGAISCFVGIVREKDDKGVVKELHKEVHPNAEKTLKKIATDAKKQGAVDVAIHTRTGIVKPQEELLLIAVASEHRQEAFSTLRYILESIKKELPAWKKEQRLTGHVWVDNKSSDVYNVIKNRRSIRAFLNESIEKEKLDKILEAAQFAPSAGNLQARFFYVLKDRGIKYRLSEAALYQTFIAEAPVVLVVCANTQASKSKYGARGEIYSIVDASLSIQNILTMAYSLGLGSCVVGAFDEAAIREVLNMSEEHFPIAIVPLGYANEKPEVPERIDISKISKVIE